jgi:hypothetical protein
MNGSQITDTISIHGDEYYTLRRYAEVIAKHLIPLPLKVWCPFNDKDSVWMDVLKEYGFDPIATDTDFFTTPPPQGVQAIISNPPFSKKREVMDRIKELDLRYALILPYLWLNDGVPFDYGHQVMFFRERMHFNTPRGELNKARTNCFVLSDGLLKDDLIVISKAETKGGNLNG